MSERSLKWIEALDDKSLHKRWHYRENNLDSPAIDAETVSMLGPSYVDYQSTGYGLAIVDLQRATIGHNMLPLFCELVRQVESDAKVLGVSGETSALLDLIHKAMDMEVENVANV